MSKYRIEPDGMGNFLNPPGSITHHWHVEQGPRNDPHYMGSVLSALGEPDIDTATRSRIEALLATQQLVCSESWMQQVYRHFNHCYSPDGIERDVTHMVVDSTNSLPAERHLGYLYVKKWFPDHEPRLDLIGNPNLHTVKEQDHDHRHH